MRILLTALACVLMCVASLAPAHAAKANEQPLRIAVDVPYPPFAFVDAAGNLAGFDIEIAQALCAEMRRACEIVPYNFESIIPDIAAGKLDLGMAGMGATEERRKLVDFTERYFRSLSIFVEKPGTVVDIKPENLKGLRIATQTGTLQDTYLREQYAHHEVVLVPAAGFDEVMEMIKDGRADLALIDGLAGYDYLKSDKGADLETVGNPISASEVQDAACIAIAKNRPALRAALNEAIQAIRRNGEYGKINRKYFDFNVY